MKNIVLFTILLLTNTICIGRNHLFDAYEKQVKENYGLDKSPPILEGIQGAYNVLQKKFGQTNDRSVSYNIGDWSSNITKFVKVNDNIPILSHTDFKDDNLHVIGFTKAGEILQFIDEKHEWVKIVNPLHWELQNFGDWYQIKTRNGEYGWIFAKPYGLNYSFASVIVKAVTKPIKSNSKSSSNFPFGSIIIIIIAVIALVILVSILNASTSSIKSNNSNSYSSSYSSSNSKTYYKKSLRNQNADKANRLIGHSGSGHKINPQTGRIQEEGFCGYNDTNKRVEPETGKYQKDGWFDWEDTGTRVDQDNGKIQKDGWFGWEDTGTRVNPETGIIQKEGWLGWEDTDKKIDPKTGKHQHNGWLGWEDD